MAHRRRGLLAEYDGEPISIGGVDPLSREGTDDLNLFYRLDPAARGRGFARELTTAATVYAAEWAPERPVIATIAPGNEPSLRTARSASNQARCGKHWPLFGFGFVVGMTSVARHRCTLKRVMTSPDRGGTGLEKFYQRCGYVETGRVTRGLRFSFGDRDDVDMTHSLDG